MSKYYLLKDDGTQNYTIYEDSIILDGTWSVKDNEIVELTEDELECIVFVYGYHGEKGTEIDKIEKLLEIKGKW